MEIDNESAKAFVMGTMVTTITERDGGKFVVSDLRDIIKTETCSLLGNKFDVDAIFDEMIATSIFVVIGDEVVLSERGRLLTSMAYKKMAVADLTGDPIRASDFDEEEINKLRASRGDIPG